MNIFLNLIQGKISDLFNKWLVLKYDALKEKNATLALIVSTLVLAIGYALNQLLDTPQLIELLPNWLHITLEIIVGGLTFLRIAMTGARTSDQVKVIKNDNLTDDLTNLNKDKAKIISEIKSNNTNIASHTPGFINDILKKQDTAPAPNLVPALESTEVIIDEKGSINDLLTKAAKNINESF